LYGLCIPFSHSLTDDLDIFTPYLRHTSSIISLYVSPSLRSLLTSSKSLIRSPRGRYILFPPCSCPWGIRPSPRGPGSSTMTSSAMVFPRGPKSRGTSPDRRIDSLPPGDMLQMGGPFCRGVLGVLYRLNVNSFVGAFSMMSMVS
jgi:hypothetical protein